MTFSLSVPLTSQGPLTFPISPGETIFALGANGSGKSSLMHHFYSQHREGVRRISAHRQTWFSSGALTLSAYQKRSAETYIQNSDRQANARWSDEYSAQRASIAVYDLIDAENVRARTIAGAVDAQDLGKVCITQC